MTPNEIYISVISKLNKNLGTDNITVDKPRVVLTFNENQIRRVSLILERKIDDTLREIQGLLVSDKPLEKAEGSDNRVSFKLPLNYFEFSSVYAIGSSETCKKKVLYMWEIKDPNVNEILSNEHLKPSFDYEEIPFTIGDSKINVFKTKDFSIDDVYLTYYKYPKKIDIAGYINIENKASTDVSPELDDRFVNKVIAMTVEDFQRNFQDQIGHALSKDRVVNNN